MTSYGVALLATLAVMTNVRGTGWDWPRNKFSLPSGVRGRRKHTRLPKIKDRDHFREKSTSANRRAINTRRELRGVAASSSRTPTIENQAQPRKIKRPSRRSNMEIGRARPPRRISSNASQIPHSSMPSAVGYCFDSAAVWQNTSPMRW